MKAELQPLRLEAPVIGLAGGGLDGRAGRLDERCWGAQAHPFFDGVDWQRLYSARSPYQPTVSHELDTRNFEHFEVRGAGPAPAHHPARNPPRTGGRRGRRTPAAPPSCGQPISLP